MFNYHESQFTSIKLSFIALILLFAGSLKAQDYLFVGTYGIKQEGKSVWCFDRTWEKTPVASSKELQAVSKAFMSAGYPAPETFILKPDQAAVIFEITREETDYRCSHKSISVRYGATVELAKKQMNEDMAKSNATKNSQPQVVFEWNPKGGVHEKFTDKLGGVHLTAMKRVNSDGSKMLDVTLTNTNTSQAVMLLVKGSNKQVVYPVTLIEAGNSTTFSIPDQKAIHWFVETCNVVSGSNMQYHYEQFKQWIEEMVTSPKQPDKKGRYYHQLNTTSVGVRG